ncbi:fimbrial protein [Enterobacter cancerogenus]
MNAAHINIVNRLLLTIAALLLIFTQNCRAAQVGDKKSYNFTGIMVEAIPCAINGDQPVTVTFGNVGISKIDTGRYVQDLRYTLNCGGATSKDKVSMFIKADPATWDAKAIATSVNGLGAQVLKDGSPLELNTALTIPDPLSPPALQIRLVKDPSANLTDQPFTAFGTLVVEYL